MISAVVLAFWDPIAAFGWGVKSTESYWIHKYLKQRPLAILGIGILLGHFLAPMIEPQSDDVLVKPEIPAKSVEHPGRQKPRHTEGF